MTKTWQEEARGIEPWPPCWIQPMRESSGSAPGPFSGMEPAGKPWFTSPWYTPDKQGRAIVNLADPDVRAAFDRRLALRLGAPQVLVDEGVLVVCVRPSSAEEGDGCWEVLAGAYRLRWGKSFTSDDFPIPNDGLLFRALAWRSAGTP